MVRFVHWRLCEKYGLEERWKWCEHKTEGITENNGLWDSVIDARRPDIVVTEKMETKIIDVAIPGDTCVSNKELENIEKHKLLKDEIDACGQWKE